MELGTDWYSMKWLLADFRAGRQRRTQGQTQGGRLRGGHTGSLNGLDRCSLIRECLNIFLYHSVFDSYPFCLPSFNYLLPDIPSLSVTFSCLHSRASCCGVFCHLWEVCSWPGVWGIRHSPKRDEQWWNSARFVQMGGHVMRSVWAFRALAPDLSFLLSTSDLPPTGAFVLCSSSVAAPAPGELWSSVIMRLWIIL